MGRPAPVGRGWTGPGPGEDGEGRHRRAHEVPRRPQITPREMPDMAAVRARHQTAAMAGEHAHHAGGFDESTARALTRSWQDVSALHDSLRLVAADVLVLAQVGGMPDSYWLTDSRVARACVVLGIEPEQARDIDWTPDG